MWISPDYEREYRDFIARGRFESLLAREREHLTDALKRKHPALIANSLTSLATCYSMRGMVSLLEKQPSGWHDLQAGYWAALYALKFEIIACTLPAWSAGRTFNRSLELAILSGFSRLFQQQQDREWLTKAVERYYETGQQLNAGQPGKKLLTAMISPTIDYTSDELLADRRACCKTREAHPKRPTEVVPVGVLDLETLIHYPADSAFSYGVDSFRPTEDEQITDSIVAYHVTYP